MTENGFAAKRIAKILKVEFKEIQQIIKEEDFNLKKENDFSKDRIMKLYDDGVSAKNLGIKYSIDKRRVQKWAKEHGMLREQNESHRFTFFNENFFDEIDTIIKSYWLGFLYASGYNNKKENLVSLTLGGQDSFHLYKIASFLNLPKDKIVTFDRVTDNKAYTYSYIKLRSQHLCEMLASKGFLQTKLLMEYPKWLYKGLDSHFIRGLFDGDGSLKDDKGEWKWSLTSTKGGYEAIKSIIEKETGVITSLNYTSNTYELQVSGNDKVYTLIKWLYEDSTNKSILAKNYFKYGQLTEQQSYKKFFKEETCIINEVKVETEVKVEKTVDPQHVVVPKILEVVTSDNPNLKPRKKIWIGELDFPETDNIENDLDTLLYNEHFVWKGNKLTNKWLRTINEDARDEIAKDVFNFLVKYDFNQFRTTDDKVLRAFYNIRNYEPKTEVVDGITLVSNAGTSGHLAYKKFFPNIIKIKGSTRPSIYDVLNNREKLWAVIRNRMGNTLLYNDDRNGPALQYPMSINISQLIIGSKNSGLASMGSIFKPTVAKAIYKKWAGDGFNVLDYSCGFGTRLLGLMSCDFKDVKYFGYEPNTETFNGLINMIDCFKFNAHIKKCGSEEEIFEEKMDLAMSSPPYFNQEVYSEEPNQCYNRFPEYDKWLEGYWRGTVKNISTMLKPDGIFGVNIGNQSNEFMQRLERDLNRVVAEEGFKLKETWYMKTSKSHLSGKKGDPNKKVKLEGIFFYERI